MLGVKNADNGGAYIKIEVIPNSKKREIRKYNQWRDAIEVCVKSPPKGGKANKEVENFLKEVFNANVKIVKGHKSQQKLIFIELNTDAVVSKLKDLKIY